MHELGLTQEILEIVTQRAQERKVTRVVLEIGKLSCVLPDAIRFCFDLCAQGTIAEGAQLEIVQQPDQQAESCIVLLMLWPRRKNGINETQETLAFETGTNPLRPHSPRRRRKA